MLLAIWSYGSAGVHAAVPIFGPIASFSTAAPGGVAAADFNNDGRIDVATADPIAGVVTVQSGNGDGTFNAPQTVYSGGEPEQLVTADLNADGNADLVVGDVQSGSITVLLGNGDGTFHQVQTLTAGPVYRLRIVDFNADGIPDLAVISANSDVVELFPGKGDGTFGTPVTINLGFDPSDIAVADINGDGYPDVLLADGAGPQIAVLLASAMGQFGQPIYVTTAHAPAAVTVVPDAQTGFLDLVASEAPTPLNITQGWVQTFTGDGAGHFTSSTIYPLRAVGYDISATDLNGDGIPDLTLLNTSDDSVSVLLGSGMGAYAPAMTYRVGYSPYGFAVADVNADGLPDIITTSSYSGTVDVELNQGSGTFPVAQEYSYPVLPLDHSSDVAPPLDVNGDGHPDEVVTNTVQVGNQSCTIATAYLNDGAGTMNAGPSSELGCGENLFSGSSGSVILQDMNGDGKPDLVFLANQNNVQGVAVAYGNGDGSFQPTKVYAQGSLNDNYFGYSVGDVNGDGRPDIIVSNLETDGLSVYLQQPDGTFLRTFDVPNYDNQDLYSSAVTDLANNGSRQLVVSTVLGSDLLVYPVLPGGAGVGSPVSYPLDNGVGANPIVIADVNKDGWPDVITTSRYGFAVLLSKGDGTLEQAVDYYGYGGCSHITVADMNGDGNPDVLCTEGADNENFTVYYGNGDGTFRLGPSYSGLESAVNIYSADLNGDGKPDVVIPMNFFYSAQVFGSTYPLPAIDVFFQKPTSNTLPPVSITAHYYVPMDTPIEFSLQGTDASGAAVQKQVVIQPSHGTLSVSPTNPQDLIYTPDYHYYGFDHLGYETTSANGTSNVATITLEVYNTNSIPTAQDVTYSISENSLLSGTFSANDADGDSLTFSLISNPKYGMVNITDIASGTFTYTPNSDYVGSDQFIFQACDWNNACGMATVIINITAPNGGNGVPTAKNGSIVVNENSSYMGTLPGSDSDGDALIFSIISPSESGTVSITNAATGTYKYKPKSGYSGNDYFDYKVSDSAFSSTATIRITVKPVNTTVGVGTSGGGGGYIGWTALLMLALLLQFRMRRLMRRQ